jgi:hypothetical protein
VIRSGRLRKPIPKPVPLTPLHLKEMLPLLLILSPSQPLLDMLNPRSMAVVYEHCTGRETNYQPVTATQQAQLSMLMDLHCPFFRGEDN